MTTAVLIRAYTGLDRVPKDLEGAQEQIAVLYFNRQGMEGERSRSDGASSVTVDDLPRTIAAQLDRRRVVRRGVYAWGKRTR